MHLGFRITTQETDSRIVSINCPVCGRHAASAPARDLRQMIRLFYVVPVFYHRPTLVDCPCGASLVSTLKARDLEMLAAEDSIHHLRVRISPILKTLVFGGIVAWILPGIGTIWTGIAYGWARRYSGWIRPVALLLFLLSLLPTGVLLWTKFAPHPNAMHAPHQS